MVDLISTRTIDLTKLAMDGLTERQKAISSNIANVMTPNYQRKDVQFEDQLREIVNKDDVKETIKVQNSMQYNPSSLDALNYGVTAANSASGLTPQQARYLQSDIYNKFQPQVEDDTITGSDATGNNVNIESESMSMAQNGLKYNVLATLEQRQFSMIRGAIKGDSV